MMMGDHILILFAFIFKVKGRRLFFFFFCRRRRSVEEKNGVSSTS